MGKIPKKAWGLLLALTMILNTLVPGFAVLAQAAEPDSPAVPYAEPTGTDVSEHVKITNLEIRNQNSESTTIDPNQSGGLEASFDFTVDNDSVKAGDYFKIVLSDNMNFNGDVEASFVATPAFVNSVGAVIAEGTYDKPSNTFTYVFTDYVETSRNIKGHANFSLWVDRENVTMPGRYEFTVTAAGETASRIFDVRFTNSPRLVDSFIPLSNPATGDFTQVVYVNPKHEYINNVILTIIADFLGTKTPSVAQIKENITNFTIYEVPKYGQYDFPYSFGVDPDKFEEVYIKPNFYTTSDGIDYVEFDFQNYASDGRGYIVVMNSKTTGEEGLLRVGALVELVKKDEYGNIIRRSDGSYDSIDDYGWNNQNIIKPSDAGGEGENNPTYQIGDYVWQDLNKDGLQDPGEPGVPNVVVTLADSEGKVLAETKTDENGLYIFSDLQNGDYKVTFELPDGYVLTNTNIGENEALDSNGLSSEVTIQDASNYTIDLGLVREPGTFQEHHEYTTYIKDYEGNLLKEKTTTEVVHGEVEKGYEDDTYTTQQQPREGYDLTKVYSDNGAAFNEDGTPKTEHYVANDFRDVHYEYERVKQPGRFQDIHKYYIEYLDEDGNVVGEPVEITNAEFKHDVLEGYPEESFNATKLEKTASELADKFPADLDRAEEIKQANGSFKLRSIDNSDNFEETDKIIKETGEVVGNFKAGETKEATYKYYLRVPVAEKGFFQEHHNFIEYTKTFDGQIIESETKTSSDDKDIQSGLQNEKYTTQAKTLDSAEEGYKLEEGYVLTSVDATEGAEYKFNGEKAEANFIPGKFLGVTYNYEKEKQPGRFVEEHHYFIIEKDESGNIIGEPIEQVELVEKPEFKEDYPGGEGFTSELINKDGYKYNPDETKEIYFAKDTVLDDTGNVKGDYVPGVEQKVVYNYYKTLESPGSFQERHIYQEITKDYDGKEIKSSNIIVEMPVEKGNENESYTTKQVPKTGFELKEVTGTEGAKFDSEAGEETNGNFISGKDLEVTYTYEKVKQPGRFEDTHKYFIQKVDKDGNNVGDPVEVTEMAYTNEYQEGYPGENKFWSSPDEKEGFEYKNTSGHSLNDEKYVNEETGEVFGDYTAGETQKVTYNYYKQEQVDIPPTEDQGTFVEEHHYFIKYVDENGKPVDENGNPVEEGKNIVEQEDLKNIPDTKKGSEEETFESKPIDVEGYEYNRDETTKDNLADATTLDKDGNVKGNFVYNTEQKVVYNYYKTETVKKGTEEPTEKLGAFVEEHHYFIKYVDESGKPVDENGNPVEEGKNVVEQEDLKNIPDTKKGSEEETFESKPIDVEGYEYNRDETTKDNLADATTLDKDGNVKGNFVNNTEQKVVYNYYKTETVKKGTEEPTEKLGAFVEEHHYFIKYTDAEGNEQVVEQVDLLEIPAVKKGTEGQSFSSSLISKEGYDYDAGKTVTSFQDGTSIDGEGNVSGNFVAGTEQKVVYNYYKTINNTTPEIPVQDQGAFYAEHHYFIIYKYTDENGEIIEKTIEQYDEFNVDQLQSGPAGNSFSSSPEEKNEYVNEPTETSGTPNGNFEAGKVQTASYNYYKTVEVESLDEIPEQDQGAFYAEHHYFITYKYTDENGEIIEETIEQYDEFNVDQLQSGSVGNSFSSNPEEKNGYVNKADETSGTPNGNFEAGSIQKAYYNYYKTVELESPDQIPVPTIGGFIEEHHYFIIHKDKDGKITSTEEQIDLFEGPKLITGTEEDTFSSGLISKTGYVYDKALVADGLNENTTYNKETGEVSGKFVAGQTQKVIYNYYKTITDEEPGTSPEKDQGTFTEEHHYYIKYVDKNGNPVDKNGNPVKPGENIVEQIRLKEGPKTTTGKDGEEFSSKLINKTGYKYDPNMTDKIFAVGKTSIDEDGNVIGKYVDGVGQDVVYHYYKTVTIDKTGGGTEDPDKPGTEDPNKPGTDKPGKPGTEDPNKPGTDKPGKPGTEDPNKPGTDKPGKPGTDEPNKPGTDKPGKPGTDEPNKPGTDKPGKPGTEDPNKPGNEVPTKPEKPSKPTNPDKPHNTGNNNTTDKPSKSDKPSKTNTDKKLPETGLGVYPGVFAKLITLTGGAIAVFGLKKKKEDEE